MNKNLLLLLLLITIFGCSNSDNEPGNDDGVVFLELINNPITSITSSKVRVSAAMPNYQGFEVNEVGFCWSTSSNPSLSDNTIISDPSFGEFSSNIISLDSNTKYYVKAYAKHRVGITYSNEVSFITQSIDITCQNTFRYDPNSRESGTTAVKTSDGGLVVGFGITEYCNGCITDTDAALLKYNSNCELQWQVVLNDPNTNQHPEKIIQDSDGNILISGLLTNVGGLKTFITKFNQSGVLIWEKIIDENTSDQAERYNNQSLIQTLDGNYALAGNWNPEYFSTDQTSNFSLIKISKEGELLFKENFGSVEHTEHAWDIVENSNGDLMLVGTGDGMNDSSNIKIMKFTSDGDFLWEKLFSKPNNDYTRSVISTNDGNMIIAAWTNSYNIDYFGILLVKIDWEGNVIWEKSIQKERQRISIIGPNSLIQSSNNDLLIGAVISDQFSPGSHALETDFLGLRLDSNGNVITQRILSSLDSRTYDKAQCVVELNNGDVVLIGEKEDELFPGGDSKSDIWIVKLEGLK